VVGDKAIARFEDLAEQLRREEGPAFHTKVVAELDEVDVVRTTGKRRSRREVDLDKLIEQGLGRGSVAGEIEEELSIRPGSCPTRRDSPRRRS
jgi:hypothetical protein